MKKGNEDRPFIWMIGGGVSVLAGYNAMFDNPNVERYSMLETKEISRLFVLHKNDGLSDVELMKKIREEILSKRK